jgi:isopentenyl-diphosphate Delta-isomerase
MSRTATRAQHFDARPHRGRTLEIAPCSEAYCLQQDFSSAGTETGRMSEQVILVDAEDREQGVLEKSRAHREGRLHRAFSVFVFGSNGTMLLQRRALDKYHSGGLWTNTCCSHPRPGESTAAAAHRRLQEEMGFDCALEETHTFVYRAALDHGMHEHELDHVLVGRSDAIPRPMPDEVMDWGYFAVQWIWKRLGERPDEFTVWFRIAMEELARRSLIAASRASR